MGRFIIPILVLSVIVLQGETAPNSGGYYYPVPKIPFRYPNELDPPDDAYGLPRRTSKPSRTFEDFPRREELPRREETSRRRQEEESPRREQPTRRPEAAPTRGPEIDPVREPERSGDVRIRTTTTTEAPSQGRRVITTTQEEEVKKTSGPTAPRRRVEEEITREEVLNLGPEAIAGNRTRTMVLQREGGGREIVTEEITVVPNNNRGRPNANGIITMTTTESRGVGGRRDSISDVINNDRNSVTRTTTTEEERERSRDLIFIRSADGTTRQVSESELAEILSKSKTGQRSKTFTTTTVTNSNSGSGGGAGTSLSTNIARMSSTQSRAISSYAQDDDVAAAGSSAEEILVRYENDGNGFGFVPNNLFSQRQSLLNASPEEIASRTGAQLISF